MKKSGLFATVILFLTIIFSGNITNAKTLEFAAVSDIHYSQNGNQDAKKALNGFATRTNENNYKFVIFLGDNIEKSKEENLNGFLKVTKNIKTPYYITLGNRDAHKISGIEKKNYIAKVAKTNCKQPKENASYYFYPNSDIIAIVLDNVSSGLQSNHGIFTQKTLLWLDEVLTKNKNKKAIIFQHVPYITPYENESHELLSPSDYRAVILRHDNIIAIISGHYHKEYKHKDKQQITHISVPALYENPYNYLEIRVKYDKPIIGKTRNFEVEKTAKPAI